MKEKAVKVESPICPRCGKCHNYRRIGAGEQVCQKCGHVWKPEKEKNDSA